MVSTDTYDNELDIGIAITFLVGLILLGGGEEDWTGYRASGAIYGSALYRACTWRCCISFSEYPAVFASIFEGAFHPSAVTGGVIGSFFLSMKKGVSRGIFSNEAGLGTGSIAHACADTRNL